MKVFLKLRNSCISLYRYLLLFNGNGYFNFKFDLRDIRIIFKIRTGLISLNDKPWRDGNIKQCSLCNTKEIENVEHFLGRFSILGDIRLMIFKKRFS